LHFKLRDKILFISQNVYKKYYEKSSKIHDTTDLNQKCIKAITDNLSPKKIIDVGCGNGFLLKTISNKNFQLYASDIKIHSSTKKDFKDLKIKFKEENILDMKYKSNSFDTVICTHTLEHLLDIKGAYEKLLKITKKKLIIVVPQERPYKYTFNGHIHFFPYASSFINAIRPRNKFKIINYNRDFFYIEYK